MAKKNETKKPVVKKRNLKAPSRAVPPVALPSPPISDGEGPYLEDILIGLQKSFSRVSASSADVPDTDARALIVGEVKFEIGLKVSKTADDKLLQEEKGPIELKLAGTLQNDIRVDDTSDVTPD